MTGKELTPFLRAWGGLWYVYFGAYSNYAKSKECLQHMEELSEKLGAGRANVNMTYGVMYETIAQQTNDDSLYADACKYYQKAISQAMHEKEYDAVLTSFSNMATIITEAKIDKSVLDREYPNVLKAGEDKRLKFEFEFAKLLYKCIGVAMEGKYEQAVAVCNDMLKLTGTKAQLKRYWLYIYNERSELYAKLGRYDLAISDAKKLRDQAIPQRHHLLRSSQQHLPKPMHAEHTREGWWRIYHQREQGNADRSVIPIWHYGRVQLHFR